MACTSWFLESISDCLTMGNPLNPIVLSQYTSISLPFQTVFNGGWSSMSLYNEKGLMMGRFNSDSDSNSKSADCYYHKEPAHKIL